MTQKGSAAARPAGRPKALALMTCMVAAGCARKWAYCPSPPALPFKEVPPITAGEYELVLRAECGQRSGNEAEGRLSLLPARQDDRSPVTGEVATDMSDLLNYPLYGFTDVAFGRVAAPMCKEDLPTSRDPLHPGVIVDASDWHAIDPSHPNTPALLIGTVVSRTDKIVTDGCGIALPLETWDGRCYRGHWDRSGIVAGGNGTFRLCAVHSAADGGPTFQESTDSARRFPSSK